MFSLRHSTVMMWACLLVLVVTGSRAWLVPGEAYYYYHAGPSTWREAQDACVSQDSTLAVPDSRGKLQSLGEMLVREDASYVHVGFHCLFQRGQYVTVFGELLNETRELSWERGAPLTGPTYKCGALSRRGELAVLECEQHLPFVCENQLWSEYEYFVNVGYYRLYTGGLSWAEAKRRCKQDGAHLAVIGSQAEADVLRRLIARFPTLNNTDHDHRALVGFHTLYATRPAHYSFYTVLGQSLDHTGYTRWMRGQPAVAANWHCGAVNRNSELLMVSCANQYAFFCEHDL